MKGLKHLVECHCVLPQYRKRKEPPYHSFVVFSLLDDSDTAIPKHARCNNWGVIHNFIDLCKSEILAGQEVGAVMTTEDCGMMLPSGVKQMLETYGCDVPDWEHALFILQNEKWGDFIIIHREETETGDLTGKILKFNGPGNYRLEPFLQKRTV
jgi:hypothetical protein